MASSVTYTTSAALATANTNASDEIDETGAQRILERFKRGTASKVVFNESGRQTASKKTGRNPETAMSLKVILYDGPDYSKSREFLEEEN